MILGVIPARGGSKGLPRKNLRPFLGRPLVCWSIEAAKRSRLMDRFLVSTEDREIAQVARAEGAEVLDRPGELATDTATTVSVLQHVIGEVNPDVVVLLQPTSPIRVGNLIDRAIRKFLETGADTVATGFISYQYEWGTIGNIRRQDLAGWFHHDGNVSVHRPDDLVRGQWFGKVRVPMIVEPYYNIEIDDEWDWVCAEACMKRLQQERRVLVA